MQSINVFELGIRYLSQCIQLYMENCGYLAIYIAGLVWVLLKGNTKVKQIFLPSALLLLVTVYNPIFPLLLDKIFDVNKEFYRFLWITPIILLIPYGFAAVVIERKRWISRIALTTVMLLLICLSGNYIYKTGYPKTENEYKMPSELLEIVEAIHQDSDEEFPKAIFEYDYNMLVRQYDPTVLLAIDREKYIYAMRYEITEEMMQEETIENRLLAALIRGQNIAAQDFTEALEKTGTEYVVVSKGNVTIPYIRLVGLEAVNSTKGHIIFRYYLKDKERESFELVDYTQVRKLSKFLSGLGK